MPVNNIDNETVHIKILDDDPRHLPSQEDGDSHQQDMMRSIKMLVGGTGMTVKSNKNEIFDDLKGSIDLNQIKLSMPSASLLSAQKQKYAQLPTDEIKTGGKHEHNMSVGEIEQHDHEDEYEAYAAKPEQKMEEPKYLKGN